MYTIAILAPGDEPAYRNFVEAHPQGTFHYGLKYRNLLNQLLPSSDSIYLLAKKEGQIVGILPTFIRRSQKGNLLNSLPFYGSHGGPLTAKEISQTSDVKRSLLKQVQELAVLERCLVSTIVTPLFDSDSKIYEEELSFDFRDSRIGQVTFLPAAGPDLDDRLMSVFHSKTRNMIRKAYKSNIDWQDSSSESHLQFLADLHNENSVALGIVAKSRNFFSLLPRIFTYGRDYRVYVATKNGENIAALLLFYHNTTVEYFTPSIVEQHRSLQPMSLLIFEAMKQAISRGFQCWNWGGTGHGLEGIYRFKKRWGAKDLVYNYYTKKHGDLRPILELGKSGILEEYKYFYAFPFSLFEQ
jgi:CelD/BcsL family acetyltransferase involved in cellulose biosynthesis